VVYPSKSICRWLPGLIWAAVLFCSFYNLSNYPTIWWDEGIFSRTAANLVQHGRYAFTIQSPDTLKDFDFRISAGPTVILPVALSYRLFGISVWSGRLVAGLYLTLAFILLYLSARLLLPRGPSLLAVLLSLVSTGILYWGRTVIGDVPALACFLGGVYCLIKGLQEERPGLFFWAGLCFGLAVDAKEFYGFTMLPALAALIWEYRRRRPQLVKAATLFLVGGFLPLAAYLALKAVVLGGIVPALQHTLYQKKLLCHEFFTPCTIGRIYPESAAYLFSHPLFISGILGLWLYQRRRGRSVTWVYWLVNFSLWSLFYVLAVYWERFALPALVLASPWAGYLLVALYEAASRTAAIDNHANLTKAAGIIALACLIFPLTALGSLQPLLSSATDSPFKVIDYLRCHIPDKFLIETPEYELTFLDDEHRFHLMPEFYFIESTPDKIVLDSPDHKTYDFTTTRADLLILGSFGKSVFKQNYPMALVQKYYKKIASVDYYDIYLRRDRSLGRMAKVLDKTSPCYHLQ
jgi:4-amino-4-deoxy-L-arabinose transferase-like glycosyltransferase